MIKFERSALVPYSAAQMYALVNDVDAYPQFLPWCSSANVVEQTEQEMIATIEVAVAGMHKAFTTRNALVLNERIEMRHLTGPFKSLLGIWRFQTLGDAGCKVELELEFEVLGGIKSAVFGMLFNVATEKMVNAFCERAHQLFGEQGD